MHNKFQLKISIAIEFNLYYVFYGHLQEVFLGKAGRYFVCYHKFVVTERTEETKKRWLYIVIQYLYSLPLWPSKIGATRCGKCMAYCRICQRMDMPAQVNVGKHQGHTHTMKNEFEFYSSIVPLWLHQPLTLLEEVRAQFYIVNNIHGRQIMSVEWKLLLSTILRLHPFVRMGSYEVNMSSAVR